MLDFIDGLPVKLKAMIVTIIFSLSGLIIGIVIGYFVSQMIKPYINKYLKPKSGLIANLNVDSSRFSQYPTGVTFKTFERSI